MNTIETIKVRKSPEAFQSALLGKEDIKAIAEAGNFAPIFGKIHITVIDNTDLLTQINETALEMMRHCGNAFAEKMANTPGYHALRHAAAFIVLSSPDGNDSMGFNMANVSCAAENMILAATSLGIGSRFMMGPIMALTQEPIKTRLNLPEGYLPLVAVALGNADMNTEMREKPMDNIDYIM